MPDWRVILAWREFAAWEMTRYGRSKARIAQFRNELPRKADA